MRTNSNRARDFRSKRVWAFSAAAVLAALIIPTSSSGFVAAADLSSTQSDVVQMEDLTSNVYLANGAKLTAQQDGNEVVLKAGQEVIIHYNGTDLVETAQDETVAILLERLGIEPGPLDMVAVEDADSASVQIHVGSNVVLYDRVETVTESPVTYVYNDVLPTWSETVLQQGKDGVHTEVYEVVYSNGREVSRQLVEEADTQATKTVIEKGTLSNFAPNDAAVSEIVKNGDGTGKIVLENGQELTFNQTLDMKATAYTTGDPGVGTITASGTTAVHALSYPLGGKYHIAHGVSNAILLAPVMRFNESACRDKFAIIYDRCCHDEVKTCKSVEEKAAWVINRLEEIVKHLEIPTSLKEFGVPESDLDQLVEAGMQVQRLLVNNPRKVTPEDARALYQQIM